jgi:putative spermidine/putrescine transport system permease protein
MALSPYATTGQKIAYYGLRVFGVLLSLFLIGPILVFVPLSFSEQALFQFPIREFGLRWYEALFESPVWSLALANSLFVAVMATALATVLGVAASVGFWLGKFPGKEVLMALIMAPLVVPSVIVGVSIYLAFAPLKLTNSYVGLIIAHAALGAPLVVVTVLATLARFDAVLLRAAASLGAGPLLAFRRVTLPLILPGVVTGAIFAFAVSFDDVVVALFVTGPTQRTLPVQMYLATTDVLELTITAAATLMLLIAMVMMAIFEFLKSRDHLRSRA